MKLYDNLNKIGFLKNSFLFKIWFICALGFFLQFLLLLVFSLGFHVIFSEEKVILYFSSLIIVISFIFFSIKKLFNPIVLASNEINSFMQGADSPLQLPVNYDDEIGLIFKNMNYFVKSNNKNIQEKLNLISLLTHDLRQYASNPITLCQLLRQDKTFSKKSNEIIDFITANSIKQVDFIDSFIELLKFENQISSSKKSIITISLKELKSSMYDDFKLKLLSKNIKLIFNSTQEDIIVEFERVLFYQILSNLIDNSIKFSTEGSTVIVDVKIVDGKYRISVIDDGIGFDPLISSELFNMFTIYGRLGTHNEKTNGIGLYLCRKIAEKFNSKIVGISNGDNKGAKFILVIDTHK